MPNVKKLRSVEPTAINTLVKVMTKVFKVKLALMKMVINYTSSANVRPATLNVPAKIIPKVKPVWSFMPMVQPDLLFIHLVHVTHQFTNMIALQMKMVAILV